MLDFSGNDQKAKQVCLHYAEKLKANDLLDVLECKVGIRSKQEAIALSQFFWDILEASAEDRDNGVEVLGETDLQFWMERIMNIISGYLINIGYEEEWEKVCDDA